METECDMCMSKALLIEGNPVDDLLDEHEDGPGVRGEQTVPNRWAGKSEYR